MTYFKKPPELELKTCNHSLRKTKLPLHKEELLGTLLSCMFPGTVTPRESWGWHPMWILLPGEMLSDHVVPRKQIFKKSIPSFPKLLLTWFTKFRVEKQHLKMDSKYSISSEYPCPPPSDSSSSYNQQNQLRQSLVLSSSI